MDLRSKLVEFFNPTVLKIVLTLIIGFIALTTMPADNSNLIGGCGPVYEIKPPFFVVHATYDSTICSGMTPSLVTRS